jgi:hypothetical protein
MAWQGWLTLAIAILSIAGIFVIDRQYQKRDRAEQLENERRRDQHADWFI